MTEEKQVFRVNGFSCANCASKFERNVKEIPGVQDAKVNFGASKISVTGDATVEELEKAGAFENLKVTPEKQKRVTPPQTDTTYRIEGFSCANCAGKFERNVKELPGVQDAKVNFGASKISVTGETTIAELEKAGAFENLKVSMDTPSYRSKAPSSDNSEGQVEKKVPFYKKHSTLLYASLFIVFGYLSQYVNGEENLITSLLFIASIVIGGFNLFKVGFKNLTRFDFDMKTLMTVAVIGAAFIGEWAEASIVVILFAISEALERYSMDKARQSIRSLMDIAPKEALIRRNGQEIMVHVDDIEIGDIMIVIPGQKIAMDGIVVSGLSAVNQAAITGESVPVSKTVDDEVFAGTLNEEGLLEVKITKYVEDTTISKIIHLVEEAQGERAPSQAFVDKFAKYYTPIIMVIAGLVVIVPPLFFDGSWETWVYQGLSVLVVGCPCALVISTPISIVSAIGNAAKKGVLIKGGIYLEEMGSLKAIAFDKTGTLTKGVPVVTNFDVMNTQKDSKKILAIITALEYRSQHPLASAIIKRAEEENVSFKNINVDAFAAITGKGIKGEVDGTLYYIGSPKLFQELNVPIPENLEGNILKLQNEGKTAMILGTEKEIQAIIAVADEVRESSQEIIEKLHNMGVKKTIMLTGDNKGTANAIGHHVGVSEIQAELMPEDKLSYIKQLRKDYGNVAMVGDGVNDAPALAASTVGIAMGGAGTDTALETADVALMADDLRKLPFTIKLSRKALNIIKANIAFAILIKLAALLLVIPGWLTLWIAIVSDMGATLLVALNSLRLMRVKE
ncbi:MULTISPECIES: heavy metal translocating P-type ATPase [Lysinibacillus]|jgi:Cd2+/Zn2+-exporting ATPase|uniref:Cd(2+)-exporting ATPase n=3 Tax=Lysinibacillus TaxID=400634 RepID=A0A0M9DG82_9BACI|nr:MULTISPECIES: heavy metal translocating P-type ATPase [Lysinibacillus]EKU41016.1 Cadmium-transporting ATPase CadA [Lysinibacillus fusiformis ZB2]WHP40838.1 heavy metal translocating P-type ATPase [Lysinibacillus boronitolerans]AJK85965.1 cadmium transporter [Lysinibacillus fusiformis]KGR82533.1 cadmium transporter [Lysinibacillus boronitolerans JCM 21713 = 10a = NBRC 103108]KHK52014.1 cadmium transporter [Lysinibacillus sp. A1]